MLQPKNNYILIKPLERERKSKGGILIPDSHPDTTLTAKVIAISDKRTNNNGEEINHIVEVGDIIVHGNFGLNAVEYNEELHYLFLEENVMGVLNG